jgi:beta-galactosidase/beta-glucuronidase
MVLAALALMLVPALTNPKNMTTRWTPEAEAGLAWHEYPRPQRVRERWQSLNGMWHYAIGPASDAAMPPAQGQIRVPYPVESHLSGVARRMTPEDALWLRRTFTVPPEWSGRVRLNFGAVDWDATVWVNGTEIGRHRGGFDPFGFDLPTGLRAENEIIVKVLDPTDQGSQPVGKQALTPEGIWYTAVTGIWQTVWLEPLPEVAIDDLWTETHIGGTVTVFTTLDGPAEGAEVHAVATYRGERVAEVQGPAGQPLLMRIEKPRLWSPDSPALYDLQVTLARGNETLDTVGGYFGIREIALQQDPSGARILLNGEPIFMFGLLDQGWWPDGLLTPPTDDALRYDLEITKRAGFNTVRKHVKVEPARFYRHCDELGLLVWQDMPSSRQHSPKWIMQPTEPYANPDGERPEDSARQFEKEWHAIVKACRPFPSVVVWVPFNEAWGQFDTVRVAELTRRWDSTRLINPASGGNYVNAGDMLDMHAYPGPAIPPLKTDRAAILGEFGGLGLPLPGHTWRDRDNWGYQTFSDSLTLGKRYRELIDELHLLRREGLQGAIYTQTTDVEGEVNGLLTYDRARVKMPLDALAALHRQLMGPPPQLEEIVPLRSTWRVTETAPGEDWFLPGFDDHGWRELPGGFGTEGTPGAQISTPWSSGQIWLRRTFEVPEPRGELWMRIHHDEHATVVLNGEPIADLPGYTTQYRNLRLPGARLRPGTNTVAVTVRQTEGGQYIDLGLFRRTN